MASSTRFQFLDKTWSYLGYDTSSTIGKSANEENSLPYADRQSSPSCSDVSTPSTSSSLSFRTAPTTPELSTSIARARVSSTSPSPILLAIEGEADVNADFQNVASDLHNDGNDVSHWGFSPPGTVPPALSSVIRPMKGSSSFQPSLSQTSRRQNSRVSPTARQASSSPVLHPQPTGVKRISLRASSLPNSHGLSSSRPSPPPNAAPPSTSAPPSCLSIFSSNHHFHPSTSSARLTGSTIGTSISDLQSDTASTFGMLEPRPSQLLPAIPIVVQTRHVRLVRPDASLRRSPSPPSSPERTLSSEPSAHLRRAIQKCRRGVKSFSYAKWLAKKMGTPLDIEVRTKHMRAYRRSQWQEYTAHTRTKLFEEIDVTERNEAKMEEEEAEETQDEHDRAGGRKHPRLHDEQIDDDEGRTMINTPVNPEHEHEDRPPRKKLKKHNKKETRKCRFAPSAPA